MNTLLGESLARQREARMELEAKQALDIWNLVQLHGVSSTNRQTLYVRIQRYLKRMARQSEKEK